METRRFIVEVVLNPRIPKEEQVSEAKYRLMLVTGVKSVADYVNELVEEK